MWAAADDLQRDFATIDRKVARNIAKVQAAYRAQRIGPHHFGGSTGYGHGDIGREALDNVRGQDIRLLPSSLYPDVGSMYR